MGDLTLRAIIHWTDADSNVRIEDPQWSHIQSAPFTYDKIVYGIQLHWQW